MITFAICDDEPTVLQLLTVHIRTILQQNQVDFQIFSYQRGDVLLREYAIKKFDVLFLDIDMPGTSGFQVAEKMQEYAPQCHIVFVTAKEDLMHQSFDYRPFHFICKGNISNPFPDLERVLIRLLRHYRQSYPLIIHDVEKGTTVLPICQIKYIKSEGHYLRYYLTEEAPPLLERGQLRNKSQELLAFDFIRIHKQYIVNMAHILYFDQLLYTITLSDHTQLPLSKKEKILAMEQYLKFKRR